MRTAKPHEIKENRHTGTPNTVSKLHVVHHSSASADLSFQYAKKPETMRFPGFFLFPSFV
jgi:hypothetical protein